MRHVVECISRNVELCAMSMRALLIAHLSQEGMLHQQLPLHYQVYNREFRGEC